MLAAVDVAATAAATPTTSWDQWRYAVSVWARPRQTVVACTHDVTAGGCARPPPDRPLLLPAVACAAAASAHHHRYGHGDGGETVGGVGGGAVGAFAAEFARGSCRHSTRVETACDA